jgi:hypothetical protein
MQDISSSIEVLDVSFNNIAYNAELVGALDCLANSLQELRIGRNPLSDSEADLHAFQTELRQRCPGIRAIDGVSFVTAVTKASDEGSNAGDFHTWDEGSKSLTAGAAGSGDAQSIAPTISTAKKSRHAGDSDSDDDDDDNDNVEAFGEPEEEARAIDDGIVHATLMLKAMLTPEQIEAMDDKFTTLLTESKDVLAKSVFLFALPEEGGPERTDYKAANEAKRAEALARVDALNRDNYENVDLKKKLKNAQQQLYDRKMEDTNEDGVSKTTTAYTRSLLMADDAKFALELDVAQAKNRAAAKAAGMDDDDDRVMPDGIVDAYANSFYSAMPVAKPKPEAKEAKAEAKVLPRIYAVFLVYLGIVVVTLVFSPLL